MKEKIIRSAHEPLVRLHLGAKKGLGVVMIDYHMHLGSSILDFYD